MERQSCGSSGQTGQGRNNQAIHSAPLAAADREFQRATQSVGALV